MPIPEESASYDYSSSVAEKALRAITLLALQRKHAIAAATERASERVRENARK